MTRRFSRQSAVGSLKRKNMRICVYCASSMGNNEVFAQAARELGQWIGQNGHSLVYGGACCGTMGILADAALQSGAYVHGIIPRFFEHYSFEVVHKNLSGITLVDDMAERKNLLVKEAHVFVVLPGSYGTMDELFETLALCQLKQIEKPVFLLNINGFYNPLLAQLDQMQECGFLKSSNRALLSVADNLASMTQAISEYSQQHPKLL